MKSEAWRDGILSGMTLALITGCVTRLPEVVVPPAEPCVQVAQARWQPMKGAATGTVATVGGRPAVRFPCTFANNTIERVSWDIPVALDLSKCSGLRFAMFCRDAAPVAHFSLYLHSGKGWYHATFFPEVTNAWCTITLNKAETRLEEKPAGWDNIDLLRFSAWRGKDVDAEFFIGDIFPAEEPGGKPLVAVVRADSAAERGADDAKSVRQFADDMAKELRALGVTCSVLGDGELSAEKLAPFQLVVLPYNPGMTDGVAEELSRFAGRGGKLLAFHNISSKLYPVLGIQGGQHVKESKPGAFADIHFLPKALPGVPENVGQKSWNITAFKLVPGAGQLLAEWRDEQGQPTGYAAVLSSSNAIVMTHVLLPDDITNKRRMLLAMVTRLVPETGSRVAAAAMAGIGKDLGNRTFDEVIRDIQRLGSTDRRMKPAVTAARTARRAAEKALAAGHYIDAPELVAVADKRLLEAWCTVQPPTPAQFRAFWCHDAFGVAGIEWDEAIHRLATNGFTAILPNMLWGGVAFYDSKVLTVASKSAEKGDQIAACLAACRKYEVQLHVWKVNWNLGHAVPESFVDQLRSANRLQAGPKGEELRWLCPSHPANRQLEIDAMVEVARKYAVDGIHFDYIRYPDNQHCFCAGCRERFEHALGTQVKHWPADVRAEGSLAGRWQDWRRGNITAVVQAVSEQARAVRPGLKISAAVFRNWSTDRDSVGQDWKHWCDKGWLDFVCPMDYTPNNQRFEGMVAQQVAWAGRIPCYPGIGVSASSSRFGAARTIEQINIACRYKTDGFVIFNYGVKESQELLP
ncbi:MAG: family 10 glycosylhydrolase, partial [Kiritimatiellaeota bacterium]|nr:family 10 glycosylhydrolase [Kiritimatiellota bacterium]